MCWFYRVRYSCGGEVWGQRQRQCARSIKSERTTTEPSCSTRRPARRLLDLSDCPVCTGEIILDAIGGGEDAGVNWATAHEALKLCLMTGPNHRAPTMSTKVVDGPSKNNTRVPTYSTAAKGYGCELASNCGPCCRLLNTQGTGRVQDRWSCLVHLRRLEPNCQPTVSQAYKYFADILCMQCNINPGHKGEHKLKCLRFDCTLRLGHEGPHSMLDKFRWCDHLNCTRG